MAGHNLLRQCLGQGASELTRGSTKPDRGGGLWPQRLTIKNKRDCSRELTAFPGAGTRGKQRGLLCANGLWAPAGTSACYMVVPSPHGDKAERDLHPPKVTASRKWTWHSPGPFHRALSPERMHLESHTLLSSEYNRSSFVHVSLSTQVRFAPVTSSETSCSQG